MPTLLALRILPVASRGFWHVCFFIGYVYSLFLPFNCSSVIRIIHSLFPVFVLTVLTANGFLHTYFWRENQSYIVSCIWMFVV